MRRSSEAATPEDQGLVSEIADTQLYIDSTTFRHSTKNTRKNIIKEVGKDEHFHIPLVVSGKNWQALVDTLVDCGASSSFVNRRFVAANNIPVVLLNKPIPVFNIDKTPNKAGALTHAVILNLQIGIYKI